MELRDPNGRSLADIDRTVNTDRLIVADSTWCHRLDIGSGGHPINQIAAHEYSHEWYTVTVASHPGSIGLVPTNKH
jgi:hypothetical protein